MASAPDLIIEQLSAITDDHQESQNENGYLGNYDTRRISTRARAAKFAAIVHALRDDYALGGLTAVEEIVHADLFDDFLDMAGERLSKGFTGPAAVLAGTVLEDRLRKLAAKYRLAVADEKGRPRSAESLGQDLRKVGVLRGSRFRSPVAKRLK